MRAVEAAAARGERPKLLFVANPNNPDGSVTPRADLLRLLDLPLVVVVDEAYIDFSQEESLAPLVRERDNLVVLRTFSKLAGMAGLRVGYGLLPLPIIKHIWKVKQPYTPNVAGTVAALAALSDRAWLDRTVTTLVAERARLTAALARAGLADAAAQPHQLHPLPRRRRPPGARGERGAGAAGRPGAIFRSRGAARRHPHQRRPAGAYRRADGRASQPRVNLAAVVHVESAEVIR